MSQPTDSTSLPNQSVPFFGVSLQIIGAVFAARFITDISTRMLYPFIPQFSRGLGLSIGGFGWLLFIRSAVGIAGPIFGAWADRYGRRRVMAAALLAQGASMAGLVFAGGWWAILPMALFGLGVAAFLPAQQAYISEQAPAHKRGRAIGVVELGWSIAAIFGLPVAGRLIDSFGWQTPLLLAGLLNLIGAVWVWRRLPPVGGNRTPPAISAWTQGLAMLRRRNVLASMGVALLVFAALTSLLTVWGLWLAADFGFDAAAIGLAATGLGVAELAGAGLSTLFIDRIGKQRGSLLSLGLLVAGLGLLPLTRTSPVAAVGGLVVLSLLGEFSIVSLIPLYSEQAPEARGTVLALVFLGIGAGSAIGAPVTTTLWESSGLWAICLADAACLLLALGLVRRFLPDAAHSRNR